MRKFMRTRAADAPPSPPPSPPRAPSRAPHRPPRANGHAGGVTPRGYAASCAEPPSSSLSGAPLFEDAEFCGARALGDASLARRVHWPRPHVRTACSLTTTTLTTSP
ncbi:hypothetical protein B5X24_HaOG208651 [Helicoverpa armigera]|uniref:Uncharacterized protein n=1 Tax=Helicoverpa armigera TaxID=29058 RepID=A0A2W1BMG7_HELAM|nr:hypothetical protein B5X24_HaOG208651 [Helicoverpa armigera]